MRQDPSIPNRHIGGMRAALLLALCCCACQRESKELPTPDEQPLPISITCTPGAQDTRATDTAFDDGDQVGLYVVTHSSTTQPTLLSSGNYADNVRFTYQGTWASTQPLYWQDNHTHADFYLYYPYAAQMPDVHHWHVAVPADQSTPSAMRQADVLVGRASDVAPTQEAVRIIARHMMSRLTVKLQAGRGFTDEQLRDARVAVTLGGLSTEATVDLATATATASGETTQNITPCCTDALTYTATVAPQEVPAGDLVTITVNGDRYTLHRAITLKAGTSHHATVTLDKGSGSVSVAIDDWATDGKDYGGTAQ